jgi:hypothetical protein
MHPLDPDDPEIKREKEHVREMLQRYKNVFGTEEGRLVLGDILTLCHFGETLDPKDPVQAAEYNVGLTIIRMAGVLDPMYLQLGMKG